MITRFRIVVLVLTLAGLCGLATLQTRFGFLSVRQSVSTPTAPSRPTQFTPLETETPVVSVEFTRQPVLIKLSETRPVHFDNAIHFWRNGESFETKDAVLLQVVIGDVFVFIPRNISSPLFIYGTGVCQVIRSPLTPLGAAVVCPPLEAGDPPILWLTPSGVLEKDLGFEQTQAWQTQASRNGSLALITVMLDLTSEPKSYQDVKQLKDEMNAR